MENNFIGLVYRDEWGNCYNYATSIGNIGDDVQDVLDEFGMVADFDKEKLNSAEPRTAGTFGYGFYDIDCYENPENDGYNEWAGTISIHEFAIPPKNEGE